MTSDQIIIVVTGVLQGGGVITFIYFYLKGMKEQVSALQKIISAQDKTLKVMEQQVLETEKVGGIYKKLLDDLPKDLENYQAIISKTKDHVILTLTQQNQAKDDEIEKLRQQEVQLTKLGTSDVRSRQTLRGAILLHENSAQDFTSFIRSISGDKEKAVELIVASSTFEAFIKAAGYRIEIWSGHATFEKLLESKLDIVKSVRSATLSLSGSYAVFHDGRLAMDHAAMENLKSIFTSIKANLQTIQ